MAFICKDGKFIRKPKSRDPNRKTFSKGTRDHVRSKFNGCCAYCGAQLGDRWHVDHKNPISRGGEDTTENLMPACGPCNNAKFSFTIEEFRKEMERQVERGRRYSINFRNAEKFKLIRVMRERVVFISRIHAPTRRAVGKYEQG